MKLATAGLLRLQKWTNNIKQSILFTQQFSSTPQNSKSPSIDWIYSYSGSSLPFWLHLLPSTSLHSPTLNLLAILKMCRVTSTLCSLLPLCLHTYYSFCHHQHHHPPASTTITRPPIFTFNYTFT